MYFRQTVHNLLFYLIFYRRVELPLHVVTNFSMKRLITAFFNSKFLEKLFVQLGQLSFVHFRHLDRKLHRFTGSSSAR